MVMRKKGVVFRVRGLPASQPDDTLRELLMAAIDDNLEEGEQSKLDAHEVAIVPSCYKNDEKVALVEFRRGEPAFLSELMVNPLGEWQIEMGDTDISFDRHFFGFTQLYPTRPESPATADIIAITGLDGHAYGSWRGQGNLGRMWLRDFLSKDLPCCRTMTYGYNSKLSTHGVDTILDYGRGLIEELKKIRNTPELRMRPLLFIAHSFGGIILAHCLVKAVQMDESDHPTIASLHNATYGMLLFGIPHKGLIVDDIMKMVAGEDNHPRSVLLEQVRSKSDLLAHQLVDFKNLIRDRKVVSFYEMGQTRQLEFDSAKRRWRRTGEFITSVDADSALLQLPDSTEDKIPLDANHSRMVKFDTKNDQGYTSACEKLRQFEKDAPGVVRARFLRGQNRPEPTSMIPFQRDRAFVGREDILVQLHERLEQAALDDHSRIALVGLGGIGKSQIAVEYAYRLRKSSPQTWVFWVHASNAARFRQAYMNIADKIELPGRDDPKSDILRLVYNWLCDEQNGRWLMILDNADDDRVFSTNISMDSVPHGEEAPNEAASLASFLPQSSNGWIFVTSRDLVAATNLVGGADNVFQVEPMAEKDALVLLKNRVSIDEAFEEDAKNLVQVLGHIPLAVTQAAAYLSVRVQTITVSTYLELFRESEENQIHLLSSPQARDLRRDDSVPDAIITTWLISFEQIKMMSPEAADLLSLMAMFDRQGIPGNVLYDGRRRLQFEDAVAPLISFSLIRALSIKQPEQRVGECFFEMHDLVQLATRSWLEVRMQLDRWQKASLRIMAAAFPRGQHETWASCRVLLPHALKILSYIVEDKTATLDRAKIAHKTGRYLLLAGEYAEAERIGRIASRTKEEMLGVEHPETLTSMANLAAIYKNRGHWKEAEKLLLQVMETFKMKLGTDHPKTLSSIRNLASIYRKQGRWEEAEKLGMQVMEARKIKLGKDHPKTLNSMASLASTYRDQGRWEEAEKLEVKVMETLKIKLGTEHPDTLASMANLASTYWKQGRWEKAENLLVQVMETFKAKLGTDHPHTLTSMAKLASTYRNKGRLEEAEKLFMQVMETFKAKLGMDHPHTLASMAKLASTYRDKGRLEEAEKLFMQVMEARKAKLGMDHPETLTSMSNLAFTWKSQGYDTKALELMRNCVQLRQQKLGPSHPDFLSSLNALNLWQAG